MIANKLLIGLLLGTLFFQVGCASKRTAGWDKDSAELKLTSRESRVIWKTAVRQWRDRHEKESLLKALEGFEKVAKANPDHYEAMIYLCRGKYLLADGHTDEVDAKKKIFEEGITWGERAMATNPDFRKKMKETEGEVEDSLSLLNRKQIDSIYWTATNLGKWAANSGIATRLKYKGRIKKMINRVGELDKEYFYHAFDRFYGAYYAIAPGFAGGDINKSKDSFDRSIKMSKNYLGTKVLKAKHWATKAGDKKVFTKLLKEVLAANPKADKKIMPENIIEQRKAKKLLSKTNELF